jgi:predicted transcriptional regulator
MKEKGRGRVASKDPIAIIHVYLDSEIYKKIQALAEKRYTSMAAIVRQVVSKMIKEKESI